MDSVSFPLREKSNNNDTTSSNHRIDSKQATKESETNEFDTKNSPRHKDIKITLLPTIVQTN